MHAPMTLFLKEIYENLKTLDIPIYTRLPAKDIAEPFFVIGEHQDDDTLSAKINRAVVRTELQVDLFYPYRDRAEIEDLIYHVKSKLSKQRRSVMSTILYDDTLGRQTYHVVFTVTAII